MFLQGSYGNDTNIYSESDVDLVCLLNDIFRSDVSRLPSEQKAAYQQAHSDAQYTYTNFKDDVTSVLTDRYGDDVSNGNKAIAIAASGNRRKADVIVAIQFRRYYKFRGLFDQEYDQGICFYTTDGTEIANYPKQHRENLTRKHQSSNRWLKPMARVMKNLRGKLVADGTIKSKLAPSYYIEGLLYNVPDDKFGGSYQDCFINAINWLQNEADKGELVCANEQYYLLRDNSHTCWPRADCESFLNAASSLWTEW